MKIKKPKNWISIILLSLWIFIEFFWIDRFHFLILIVSLILIAIFRNRSIFVIAAIIASVLLFNPSILDSSYELFQSNFLLNENAGKTQFLFLPGTGQEVLPDKVKYMVALVKENHIESYRISDQLMEDTEIYQRIIEAAWPVRMDITSPYILSIKSEQGNLSLCLEIDQQEDIILEYCP